MSNHVKRLIDEINQLPEDDRVAIVDGVWASLGEDAKDELYATDSMIDPEFRAEIERRSDEAHAHPERLIDADVAFRIVREELAKRQQARESASP
jgi:hypothetical protein